MTTAAAVKRQIETLTINLIEASMVDDQNLPVLRTLPDHRTEVTYPNARMVDVFADRPYEDTYDDTLAERSYNLRLLDGGLVQMSYEFHRDDLLVARLCFLPSPNLRSFQNEPELYLEDVFFTDILEQRIVATPLRFDFDDRDGVAIELNHPRSHLTIGQYSQCRIPATAAIMPFTFAQFILRSFYNTAFESTSDAVPHSNDLFRYCSCDAERSVIHIGVPCLALE
jgi:hypothetical protein